MNKKVFILLAMFAGITGTAGFANTIATSPVCIVAQDKPKFEAVDAANLPQAVKDVITNQYKDYTIKAAAVATNKDRAKIYKITLASAENTEKVLLLNEKGEEVKKPERHHPQKPDTVL